MNPDLRAYLDRMNEYAAARADKMNNDVDTILKALAAQTARIDSLATWKPDLEACFAKLELSVTALQAVPPTTTPISGPPSPAPPIAAASELHGQSSHGVPLHTIPPVTGMNMIPSRFRPSCPPKSLPLSVNRHRR